MSSNAVRVLFNRYLALQSFSLKIKHFRKYSTEVNDLQRPITFSKTTAAKWRAEYSRQGPDYREFSWGDVISFTFCLWATVYYFGFLRESNDIDEELSMPLGKRLFEMHIDTLRRQRQENLSKGLSVSSVDEEINEAEKLKKRYGF